MWQYCLFARRVHQQRLCCFSNQTIAGSNVTTTKPNGLVEINKGKTKIKGTNGVTISNSFEVKAGASLEIKTKTN